MSSRQARLEQKETLLDNLFQEFISLFKEATPEEKKHLATRYLAWFEQQFDPLLNVSDRNGSAEQEQVAPPGTSIYFQDKAFQDFKKLAGRHINLTEIVDNIEQVVWLRNTLSGQIIYISPAFETVWGRSCESLYADPKILIESVHPEDRVQVMVTKPYPDRKSYFQTYRILRPDGIVRWISAHTFLIHDETGSPDNMVCVAQDISAQKEIELTLRRTLDRVREQIDLSHKMSLARKPGTILRTLMSAHELRSAQRAALLFFDHPKVGPARGVELAAGWLSKQNSSPWLSESNLYEEPAFWELFQSHRPVVITEIQSDSRLTSLVREFLLDGQIQTLAIFPLVALGDWLGCLVVYYRKEHPFAHNDLRHLKLLIDQATISIYNLKLLEAEGESRLEAERANEIKTEFLAMISHELRTPLTSIIGFTTTLLAEDVTWEPKEQRDFFQTIQREAGRLQELIDHLMDLSRLEAGMLPISQKTVSLHDIMEDALPQFRALTSRQTLSMQLPANLPPVYADAKRIAQVLVNLVRNSAAYAPEGSEISISASVLTGFVRISVADQGPGILPAEHKRVFKAFQRGKEGENDQAHGAGLGLAICKGLVEAHGGRIWIKNKTTPGATVSFTIPFAPLHSPAMPSEEER